MSWQRILDGARQDWKDKTKRGSIGVNAPIDLAHCSVECSHKLAQELAKILEPIEEVRTKDEIKEKLQAYNESTELKLRIDRLLADAEFHFSEKLARAATIQAVYQLIYSFYNRPAVVEARGLHEAIRCLIVAVYRFVDFETDDATQKNAMQLPPSLQPDLCGTKKIEVIYADVLLAALKSEIKPEFGDDPNVTDLFKDFKKLGELEAFAKEPREAAFRASKQTLDALLGYLHRKASRYMSLTVDQALASMSTWKTWTGYKSAVAGAATGIGAGVANVATDVGQWWWQHHSGSSSEEESS